MTWNASLAPRIFCTFVAITCCSSCGVGTLVIHPRLDHVDLSDSTSDEVATIRGDTINLLIGAGYCWIELPDDAKRVTVNAGPVDIVVGCSATEQKHLYANLRFEALAGHEYRISPRGARCDSDYNYCIELRDDTTDEVIVEAPFCVGKGCLLDLSTGYDKALIRVNGAKGWWCKPAAEQAVYGVVSFLYVDPGPITVDTFCVPPGPGFGKERKKATGFNFIAESGHIYAFSAKKKECVQLLDVTSEETVIACEPYELIE